MRSEIPCFLLDKPDRQPPRIAGVTRTSFLDHGISHIARLIETTYVQQYAAIRDGFFQNLDARIKLLFLLFFILIVSMKRSLVPEVMVGGFVFVLAAISRLNLVLFYRKVILFGFFFGFLIAMPSAINIISGGEVVIPILHLARPYDFWIYHIPGTVGFTRHGLEGVAMLTLRVVNSLSVSFLVVYTTPFAHIIRALKSLKVPDPFLMIITLSYKYMLIFAQTVEGMYLARKGRTIEVNAPESRDWVAGRIAFLFRKTRVKCEDVLDGMLARGFSGEVMLYPYRKMTGGDMAVGSFLLLSGLLLLLS
jgi:cobalt/nickel transport system permease protein